MTADDRLPSDEGLSNAFLDAWDEAYSRWIDAGGDYGVAYDVLISADWTEGFTAHDWATLFNIGDDRIRSGPEMSPDQAAEFANGPEFYTAIVGLQVLMNDRYDREHPEYLEDPEAKIAEMDAETARLEAEARRYQHIAAIEEATAQINAETELVKAEVHRPERRGGFLSGWTTRLWRRKQVAPGVRVNLSKSGPSLTLGPKGGHVTYGPKGTTETIGLPGSGVYLQRRKQKQERKD